MTRYIPVLAALLMFAAAPHASAQRFVALGMPDSEVLALLKKFQRAVSAGDRATVAGMVNYPMRVNRGPDEHSMVASRGELLKRYDGVFTPDVRRAIVSTNLDDVLGGIEGVSLGRGTAWLTSTCSTQPPRKCQIGLKNVNQIVRGEK